MTSIIAGSCTKEYYPPVHVTTAMFDLTIVVAMVVFGLFHAQMGINMGPTVQNFLIYGGLAGLCVLALKNIKTPPKVSSESSFLFD